MPRVMTTTSFQNLPVATSPATFCIFSFIFNVNQKQAAKLGLFSYIWFLVLRLMTKIMFFCGNMWIIISVPVRLKARHKKNTIRNFGNMQNSG